MPRPGRPPAHFWKAPFLNTFFQGYVTQHNVFWHNPSGLEFLGPLEFRAGDSLTYLAVAHGLSVPRQEWPDFQFPGDVPPVARDPEVEAPLDLPYTLSPT
jgi:hypothetical protein